MRSESSRRRSRDNTVGTVTGGMALPYQGQDTAVQREAAEANRGTTQYCVVLRCRVGSQSSMAEGKNMVTPLLKQRGGVVVDNELIDTFRNDFDGQVILPTDAGYDVARRIWNASIDKLPGLIARCSGVVDVVRAVKFARTNDLLVSVKGGGHNVGGRALCDDGVVIDLSTLKGVFVDQRADCACPGGRNAGRCRSRNACLWSRGSPVLGSNRHHSLKALRRRSAYYMWHGERTSY